MKVTQRTYLTAGILMLGLGMAKPSLAITGCTNAYLMGTYNSSINNIAFENVINTLNATAVAGSSGTTGATGSTGTTGTSGLTGATSSTGTTGTTGTSGATGVGALPMGLAGTSSSINGNTPGLGRFFFDGNGNIMGLSPGANSNAPTFAQVGTYTVASNCTATLTLTAGQNYNAVIVNQGNQVLFEQKDASGNGAAGMMVRSANSCVASQYPQSFGFEFYAATPVTTTSTTGASGSTGTTGTSGSSGTTGATGASGTTGASGSSGSTGTSGASGTTGASGSSGSTGTSGASGSTGTSGTTGTTGTSGSSGTTGTSTTTTVTTLKPFSAVGVLNLDGNGNFTVTEYQYGTAGNGSTGATGSTGTSGSTTASAAQTLNGSGTYTVGSNCSLNLTFATPQAGTTGALSAPASMSILLGTTNSTNTGTTTTTQTTSSTGIITIQPVNGQVITGILISQ